MKNQMLCLSLFTALAASAAPVTVIPQTGGSDPARTVPARPTPVIPPGLNKMPPANPNQTVPNDPQNPGINPGPGNLTIATNLTVTQPPIDRRLLVKPLLTNSTMPRQPFVTNRPHVFTNRPPIFTNRPPIFTNRPTPIINRASD